MTIESPCVGDCTLDRAGAYCCGCLRTLAEITDWANYRPEQRRAIMAALPARRRSISHDHQATGG